MSDFYDSNGVSLPRISIIIPVFNVERYLNRCLDSIVAQSFNNWECILIDDGSTDSSGGICEEYAVKDSRFRVFHQKNKGVSSARNFGLDVAKGDWIGFIDADDWVDNVYLERFYSVIVSEQAKIIVGGFTNVYVNQSFCSIPYVLSSNVDYIKSILLRESQAFVWGILINKSLIDSFNIRFNSSLIFWEDFLFRIQLLSYCNSMAFIKEPLYHYDRSNERAASFSFTDEKYLSIIESVRIAGSFLSEKFDKTFENEIQYCFIWAKLFYIKSLHIKKLNYNNFFSDNDRAFIYNNSYFYKFNKQNRMLLKSILNGHYKYANFLINLNYLLRKRFK